MTNEQTSDRTGAQDAADQDTVGRLLARRTGTVGFLARELLAEIPAIIDRG